MKNRTLHICILLLLCLAPTAYARQAETGEALPAPRVSSGKIRITGQVATSKGDLLAGASIIEEGTLSGTSTNVSGRFSIDVAEGATLLITFVGYRPQAVRVERSGDLVVEMQEDTREVSEVVVTALGLKREEPSLTYSVKQISGEELTRVKDPNMINSLTGKVSGLQVNKTAAGLGASSRVMLRGMRSVAGNNQPLYVIDGIPVLNTSSEQAYTAVGGTADAGNRDGGDGVSNLNPEDVASITVLKGASAAALYGSQAANGVILITTKKGRAGSAKITFSTNLTFEEPTCLPQFQNSYGSNDGINSWGPKADMPAYDNLSDFFRTGVTSMNNFAISAGNDRYQTYFSYGNTIASGIIPNNRMQKHNINFRETASLYDGRLKIDGNVTLFRQRLENRNPPGGFYMNPLVGLYRFPRGMDITPYRENFEVWDTSRSLAVQNWHSDVSDFEQNPYWVVNRIGSKDSRNRALASLSVDFTVTSWLSLQGRGSVDYIDDKIRQQFYASTAPALCGENGRYIEMDYEQMLLYADFMAQARKTWGRFTLNATAGASIDDKTTNSLRYDSKTASLYHPNVFVVANIVMNGSAYIDQDIDKRRQWQSLFATAQVGYDDQLFVDFSARNDWASTLAFTASERSGFFYPSAGVSWIASRTFDLPEWITYGKLRAAWSRVGNDLPYGVSYPMAHISAGGGIVPADTAPFEDLKPEMTTAVEAGTEWKFLDNRIALNLTWYKTNTRNQYFKLPALTGSKYAYYSVNAGNIRNTGLEASLTGWPLRSATWKWRTEFNFALNRNKVIELHDRLPVFTYGPSGFSSSYAMKLVKGGSFGDIYGKAFERDAQGKIVYETQGDLAGLPKVYGEGNQVRVGSINPRFTLSWGNSLSWKEWSLSALVDSRWGGQVLSQTLADLDQLGVTRATGRARDAGYVTLEGTRIERVEDFYKVIGGRTGVTEYYMYDATNIRLRELSLTWEMPRKWVEATKAFKSVQVSFVGRNLFFIYKNAPFDPELVLSTGSDNQGIEVYGMPTTRNLGFNIRFDF